MNGKQKLCFTCSSLLCFLSGFVVAMHFRRAPGWPAERFGGTAGALALIPVCLLSYSVSSFYVNRWLHPRAFPRLRAALPAPAFPASRQPRRRARAIAISALMGLLSGSLALLHFSQPPGVDDRFGSTPAALLCIAVCIGSCSVGVYSVQDWLRTRGAAPRDRAGRTV